MQTIIDQAINNGELIFCLPDLESSKDDSLVKTIKFA